MLHEIIKYQNYSDELEKSIARCKEAEAEEAEAEAEETKEED
jgi:hypothetical protein